MKGMCGNNYCSKNVTSSRLCLVVPCLFLLMKDKGYFVLLKALNS
jgi:hypothetical protein